MSTKETIENKVKSLQEREEQIKQQIDVDSDAMKEKFLRIGKIALVSGVVAILGYSIYRAFFTDEEDSAQDQKKSDQKNRDGFFARISAVALPYIEKAVNGALDLKPDLKKDKPTD